MTQINQNYEIKNPQYAQQPAPVQRQVPQPQTKVSIPDFYVVPNTEKKDWRETLKSNPLTMVGYEFFLRGTERPIPTLLTWLGVGYGIDAYTKACGGEYNKSLLKRVANFGDNIQNSKLIQNKPAQFVLGGFERVGNVGKKIVKNSAILRALFNTPTRPEWKMVKSEIMPHNLKMAEDLLNSNKNLVLDFDYFKMTALHLAAKYNFYQIIPELFEYGTHMDDINLSIYCPTVFPDIPKTHSSSRIT